MKEVITAVKKNSFKSLIVFATMIFCVLLLLLCISLLCISLWRKNDTQNSTNMSEFMQEYEESDYFEGKKSFELEYYGDESDNEREVVLSKQDSVYERNEARRYYGIELDPEPKRTKSDYIDHYDLVTEYAGYDFDESGNGICIIDDPEGVGMNHHLLRFEYTQDYGETWTSITGVCYSCYYVNDFAIRGNSVYICLSSNVYYNSLLLYSDDMCQTFYQWCIPANLKHYKMNLNGRNKLMKIIDISKTDGSVIFDFYDEKEDYNYSYIGKYCGGSYKKTFLIVKTDRKIEHFDVLYADDNYIEKTAWEDDD